MLHKISYKLALRVIQGLCIAILLFHFLVISEIVPYEIVWGGRLSNRSEMIQFEVVSILVIMLLFALVWLKGRNKNHWLIDTLLWLFVALFAVNTIGNLFSKSTFEMVVFTPLTLIAAIFCARIAIQQKA